jgi:hypothetical protein
MLDESAARDSMTAPFALAGEPLVDASGLTASITLPVGQDARGIALRVSNPESGQHCVQLNSVVDPDGSAWVTPPQSLDDYRSYCRTCPERVSVAAGGGLYVLPSGDPPPTMPNTLSVRVSAIDCDTFLPDAAPPSRLRIESLVLPAVDDTREGQVFVEIILTEASAQYADSEPLPAVLSDVFTRVDGLLAPGNLRLRPVRIRRVAEKGTVGLLRGDHFAAQRIVRNARECDAGQPSWIPLVFAGCIRITNTVQMTSTEPNGFVPHIPDGFVSSDLAGGVFIKGAACQGSGASIEWPADVLAKLVAHELGHYLGLYHSVEADGTVDLLDDTSEPNIMHYVSPAGTFSPSQFRIMRRHSAVVYP